MSELDTTSIEPHQPTPEELRRAFFDGSPDDTLADPAPLGLDNALQKLGKPPFERSARTKFRLLGFLATVYEHVAEDVSHRIGDVAQADDESNDPDESKSS
ncbi:MAG: hypothetical protein AAGI46_00285 [Planctomycetota bacterium]